MPKSDSLDKKCDKMTEEGDTIKHSQSALPLVAIKGDSPNAILCHLATSKPRPDKKQGGTHLRTTLL